MKSVAAGEVRLEPSRTTRPPLRLIDETPLLFLCWLFGREILRDGQQISSVQTQERAIRVPRRLRKRKRTNGEAQKGGWERGRYAFTRPRS